MKMHKENRLMSEAKLVAAVPGYFAASLALFEEEREYEITWHPVVAWRVWGESGLAEPVVVHEHLEWGSNERFGAVLTPAGKFLFDGCVEDSLDRWLLMQVRDIANWREINVKPLPIVAAPVEPFDPAAFRPGKATAKKSTGRKPQRTASIFD